MISDFGTEKKYFGFAIIEQIVSNSANDMAIIHFIIVGGRIKDGKRLNARTKVNS